jgi:hypothetical protein
MWLAREGPPAILLIRDQFSTKLVIRGERRSVQCNILSGERKADSLR